MPRLLIRSSASETVEATPTKSGRSRHVPLSDDLVALVQPLAKHEEPGDLILTSPGGARLQAAACKNATRWPATGRGRRLHDLRHTAGCLWLAAGVPASTVQARLEHSSLQTTHIYVHQLGESADRAGLDFLNPRRHTPRFLKSIFR